MAAGVSDRERDRRPSGRPREADDRRCQLSGGEDRRGRAAADLTRSGAQLDDDVRELNDALEAVFGDEDGGSLVVDEARE